jgi:hypothetical protein
VAIVEELKADSQMRIRGRSFSILLAVVLLPIGVPLLLFSLFAVNDLAGVIFGPPAIWNRPWQAPAREDLVGAYTESERRSDHSGPHRKAQLELKADGTMVVSDLPSDDAEGTTCVLTGTGRWEGPDTERRVNLILVTDRASSCVFATGAYSGFELAGHKKPYSLYWILGDPDTRTGVWFTRN